MKHDNGYTQSTLCRVWITCIATAMTVAVSTPTASAQTKGQVDLFGGYVNAFDYESLHGGSLEVSAGISPKWAVVLDVDAAYRHIRAFYEPYEGGAFRELHIAGLAGFRRVSGRRGKFSGFWQILAGGLQEKTSTSVQISVAAGPADLRKTPPTDIS